MAIHNRAGGRSLWLMASLCLGMLVFCLLTGLMAAMMPPGTLVRLLALPFAVMGIVLLWVMPKRQEVPEYWMNVLLLVLLALLHLWPTYIVYRFGGMPSISPTKLAWLCFLSFAGINILSGKAPMARLVARCKAHPRLIGTICLLFCWRVLSAATGQQPIPQVLSLATEAITCYLVFFVALAVLRDEGDVYRLLTVLVAVAIAQALLASYESVVKHTLFDKFIALSAEDSATMLDTLREKFRDGRYRAQGTFEHPMVLAEYMAMMAPLAAVFFFIRKTGNWRWIAVGFLPLALGVIVSSRSRVGIAVLMAALLLVAALMMIPRGKQLRHGGSNLSLAVAMFLLPLLLVGGYFVMQEMLSLIAGRSAGEANSTLTRVLMLERGIPLLKASPYFGYGSGMGAVKLGFWDGTRFNIDNYWLSVALDSGVPGLLAFLGVFVGAALTGLACFKRRADHIGLAAGFMSVSLVILLGCKTVLSISSGLTLGYVLIAAILVLCEAPLTLEDGT